MIHGHRWFKMRESYWAGAAAFIFVMILLSLTGCSISTGGFYTPEGPHPQINAVVAIHADLPAYMSAEILHTPVSNAKPVTDLTVISVTKGVNVGDMSLNAGLGWQVSRLWGACDPEGFNCEMAWANGYAVSAGLTYRATPLRVDLRAYSFDNSPVGARTSLPLGIEALTLMFGFDL